MTELVLPCRIHPDGPDNCHGWTEDFYIDCKEVDVFYPTCGDWGVGGRIKKMVDALETEAGIKLIHVGYCYEVIGRRCLGDDYQSAYRELHRLTPAYRSSWTCYYETRLVEDLSVSRGTTCSVCGELWDKWTSHRRESDKSSWLDGWDVLYGSYTCSPLCQREWFRWQDRQRQKNRREEQWLRKGRRLLKETRKMLRSPGEMATLGA